MTKTQETETAGNTIGFTVNAKVQRTQGDYVGPHAGTVIEVDGERVRVLWLTARAADGTDYPMRKSTRTWIKASSLTEDEGI